MCVEPNRHGRAADAFIASYLRELLADDETRLEAAPPHDEQQIGVEPPTPAVSAVIGSREHAAA
jgi:hypothetical protein